MFIENCYLCVLLLFFYKNIYFVEFLVILKKLVMCYMYIVGLLDNLIWIIRFVEKG